MHKEKTLEAFAEGSQVGKDRKEDRLFTVPFEFWNMWKYFLL